jgi:phosphoadenosine phosphosulfate reductase
VNTNRIEDALAILREAAAQPAAVFSTSFGAEDMVVLDLIRRLHLPIKAFTLDTGRLPEETYQLMQQVEARYGRCVEVVFPDAAAVQHLVAAQGINGFYDSVERRKACCAVRKIEPLTRALAGTSAWVTGLRAAQSVTRAALSPREWDPAHLLTKFNPLHDWSEAEVGDYLRAFGVPINALHARGYPSIGCAPCTRAITAGEDIRAGRWWWENADTKECGLHGRPHSVGVSSKAHVSAANVEAEAASAASAGRRQHPEQKECGLHSRKPLDVKIKEVA